MGGETVRREHTSTEQGRPLPSTDRTWIPTSLQKHNKIRLSGLFLENNIPPFLGEQALVSLLSNNYTSMFGPTWFEVLTDSAS